MPRLVSLFMGLLLVGALPAQQNDVTLQRDIYLDLERNAACRTARIHSGLKPVIQSRADMRGVLGHRRDTSRHYYLFTEILFRRHLLQVREKEVRLDADLILDLQLGHDFRDRTGFPDTTRFYQNTRGFRVRGDLGPRVSFQTVFLENQVLYPQYLWLYTKNVGVVPGQGRTKPFTGRAYDHGWAMGNVSWSPRGWLNVQLGQGRHFVGHGYRSMLLSDASFPSPYLKFSWLGLKDRIQYSSIFTRLHMLQRLPFPQVSDTLFTSTNEPLFFWKRATFNHLSIDLGRVQLGLFESTVFRSVDNNGVRPFNGLYINPLIGLNTALNGFDGDHKQVVGLDLRVKLTDKLYVYGQGVTDNPGRYGWQAGMRWFDLFGKDLHVQLEYNKADPFLYMNTTRLVNHAQMQEGLAHPFGAYFDELVGIVDLRVRTVALFQVKANLATYHLDRPGFNNGGNILLADEPLPDPEGPLVRRLLYLDLNVSYLINQMSNMRMTVGYWMRDLTPAPDQLNTGYLYASFRMALFNRYYDF